MKNILGILFKIKNDNRVVSSYEKNILKNIESNYLLLKRNLSEKERKLLLRIIDNKDLLSEHTAMRNFKDGFKLGAKLGIELDKE